MHGTLIASHIFYHADVKAKVEDLKKLLNNVKELIASNPEALNGLELADYLCGVASDIRNIYHDVKHTVDQSSLPEKLNTKKESVPGIPTPPQSVANDFVDAAADDFPDTQKLESIQVSVPNVPQENSATSLESRKRRRESTQTILKNAKKPKVYSCGLTYQCSSKKDKQYSDKAKKRIKDELEINGNFQLFRHMVHATCHRFECDYCDGCKTFNKPVKIE